MRANLPDSREDLNDFEVELTYQIPAKPKLYEKRRETLERNFGGITNQTFRMPSRVQDVVDTSSPLSHYFLCEDEKY